MVDAMYAIELLKMDGFPFLIGYLVMEPAFSQPSLTPSTTVFPILVGYLLK